MRMREGVSIIQDDGLEQHIRGTLEDGDLNWLPEGRGGVTIAESSSGGERGRGNRARGCRDWVCQ